MDVLIRFSRFRFQNHYKPSVAQSLMRDAGRNGGWVEVSLDEDENTETHTTPKGHTPRAQADRQRGVRKTGIS